MAAPRWTGDLAGRLVRTSSARAKRKRVCSSRNASCHSAVRLVIRSLSIGLRSFETNCRLDTSFLSAHNTIIHQKFHTSQNECLWSPWDTLNVTSLKTCWLVVKTYSKRANLIFCCQLSELLCVKRGRGLKNLKGDWINLLSVTVFLSSFNKKMLSVLRPL